ncbi:hypothetical protein FACS1894168_3960 [Deltaproteobacteria bacterium]|nr:hypothetical protein FACS1894168_3960 [Deltaproteobacteria bacterium]
MKLDITVTLGSNRVPWPVGEQTAVALFATDIRKAPYMRKVFILA